MSVYKLKIVIIMTILLGAFNLSANSKSCLYFGLQKESPELHWLRDSFDSEERRGHFVIPNEENTQDLAPILSGSGGGIYLSVGTERALIGATLSQSEAVLTVDRDPLVYAYNLFSRALMALARSGDLQDYLYLRLHATEREIQERLEVALRRGVISPTLLLPLRSQKFFPWWQKTVREDSRWKGFDRDWDLKPGSFQKGNYLTSQQQFRDVQNRVLQGRVVGLLAELSETEAIVNSLQALRRQWSLPLGVVDLSNAWEEGYLGGQKSALLVSKLSDYALSDDTLSKEASARDSFLLLSSLIDSSQALRCGGSCWKFFSKEIRPAVGTGENEIRDYFRLLEQTGQFLRLPPTRPNLRYLEY